MSDAENVYSDGLLNIDTFRQMLEVNASRYAIRKAFALRGESDEIEYISYKKFFRNIEYISLALTEQLSLCGAKIAVCAKNSYEWCTAYLAICTGGCVAVPLDCEMPAQELINIFNFADVKAVIADETVVKQLSQLKDRLPDNFIVICVSDNEIEGALKYSDIYKNGKELKSNGCTAYKNTAVDPDALSVLLFTSGTTGMAKAVMLSQRNICSDLMSVASVVNINYNDTTMCVLPLHHTYQAIAVLMLLYIGGCVSFCRGLRYISQDIGFYKPTIFVSVPLILEKMHTKIIKRLNEQNSFKKAFTVGKASTLLSKISGGETKKRIYSCVHEAFGGNLRLIITGAAPMNGEIANDFNAFGLPVLIGYGLTECSPIVMCNCDSDPRPDTVGKAIPSAEVMIDAPDENGVGELCVKGPMVMLGYYNDPKRTDEVIIDGWLHTGDLGYIDSDMHYHITGRSKNVIVTKGGKNIYPEELEYYLNSDPLVLESLIFAQETGDDEKVAATVVPDEQAIKEKLKKDKLTKEDVHKAIIGVIRRINRALPYYKSIRRVDIREQELEKNSSEKIKRSQKTGDTHDLS